MDLGFQIGGGLLLTANTLLLLRLSYQAGKIVQQVEDHAKTLERHDQDLRELRGIAR